MSRYHVCPTPGCPNLTTGGLCDSCERERQRTVDAARPAATARGYGVAWSVRRSRYLRDHPICEEPGCGLPSTDVDHIDGSGPRGDNSDQNLQALCHGCHSRLTVRHNAGFGRQTRPRP